jgi:hypothetical protein
MEKIDILVKGVPVPVHNMFKGMCSMSGKTVSEGIVELLTAHVQKGGAEPEAGGKKKR